MHRVLLIDCIGEDYRSGLLVCHCDACGIVRMHLRQDRVLCGLNSGDAAWVLFFLMDPSDYVNHPEDPAPAI